MSPTGWPQFSALLAAITMRCLLFITLLVLIAIDINYAMDIRDGQRELLKKRTINTGPGGDASTTPAPYEPTTTIINLGVPGPARLVKYSD